MKKQLLFLMVLFFLFSGINMTYATPFTWIGGASGSWTTATNWSPSTGYPGQGGSTTDAVIFNSSANVTLPTLSGGYSITTFTINGGFNVILNQTGTDAFKITDGSNGLRILNSATLTIKNAPNFNFARIYVNSNANLTLNNSTGILSYTSALPNSAIIITNSSQITIDYFFTFNGACDLNGSSKLILTNNTYPASFTNSGGTFTVTDSEIDINYQGDTFSNAGTMSITGTLNTANQTSTSYVNFPAFTYNTIFSNSGILTVTGTIFKLNANGYGTIPGCQFQNFGAGSTVNSTNSIFILGGLCSSLINDYGATFNANNTEFDLTGGENDSSPGNSATNSIYNGGIFNATIGSKFIIPNNNNNANIFNGGSTWYTNSENSADTAFFILDPTSKISATGAGSLVYNNYPNQNPSNTATGVFILQSDINNSAYVEGNSTPRSDFSTGATFMGQYYVQRFFTGQGFSNYRGYRLISSPVNNNQVKASSSNYADFSYLNKTLQTGTNPSYPNNPVLTYYGLATGGTGTGFTFYNKNPLFYLYNETYNPVSLGSGFTASKYPGITDVVGTSLSWASTATGSNVTGTSQVPVGNGALIYYVGPNTRTDLSSATAPDNSTVSYLGYLNQGDITVYPWFTPGVGTLSYTSALPAQSYPGINLVGNPYPAMIDLGLVSNDNPNFTTFYELDDASSQINYTYASFSWDGNNGLTSGANASRYVASGQGFFVTATAAGQALTFKEDQKVYDNTLLTSNSNPAGVLVKNGGKTPLLNSITSRAINKSSGSDFAGLHLMLKKDSTNYHETGIYFGKNYSDKLDKVDAIDMDGISIKTFLSSYTADGARVSINGMGTYTSGKTVKLYVKGTLDGTYSLNLTDVINIDPTIATINLIDNYKNTTIDLVQAKTYSFDIANADTNSFGANRFVLSVQRKPLAPYQLISFNATKVKSNIAVAWQTSNEGNYTSFGLQKLDITSNKYQTIDSLQSSGTGNYVFNDPSAIVGDNTYRLAQNNIDGMVTYSQPVNIKYGLLSLSKTLGIYPNPVKDNAMFDFSGIVTNQNGGTFEVNVYNSLGVLMMQKTSTTNFLNSDLSSLKPGIYVVQVKSSNGSILGKSTFIKN